MEYESFKSTVLCRLSEDIPDPKHISVQNVPRNNGELLEGLVILENGVNIGPTIYLDHYYRTYRNGTSFSAVYRQIVDSYEMNKTTKRIDVKFFTDFERVRERIVIKLVNNEKNMELLNENVPHIPFLDLALVFYCLFPVDRDIGNATILIDNSHLALWDVTAEDLLPIAMENTRQLLPPRMLGIREVLSDLMDLPGKTSSPPEEEPALPMYVLSNEDNMFGAACMAYDGLMPSLSDQLESDLIILPSSIHEIILVPCDGADRIDDFTKMVREVNDSQVAPEDILSDHAYYYSRDSDEILY